MLCGSLCMKDHLCSVDHLYEGVHLCCVDHYV